MRGDCALALRLLSLCALAVAVSLATSQRAHAACTPTAATVTCTGNLSTGVVFNSTVTTLNVNNLTTNIAPATGVEGIDLRRTGSTGAVGANGTVVPPSPKGGNGGTGGGGVDLTVRFQTVGAGPLFAISTNGGSFGHGILTQGAGGNGGKGGNSILFQTGGAGGNGGSGGKMRVTSVGNITTSSNGARGFFVRSIAGNGGRGGNGENGGAGGWGGFGEDVTVTSTGNIRTKLNNSEGIFAQSRGGKGGTGGTGATGGAGGLGRPGGKVEVRSTGNITTDAAKSHGIWALSGAKADSSVRPSGGTGGAGVGLKGVGGKGGNGVRNGDVVVSSNGTITTKGQGAIGILAQSLAADGGTGGAAGGIEGKGGNGGTGGWGGKVTVTSSGKIETKGSDSHGIFAQSAGGKGGSGGAGGGVVGIGGAGNDAGDGGQVIITNSAEIIIAGTRSKGIWGLSSGGGGGSGGTAGGIVAIGGAAKNNNGDGGTVSVANNGAITTSNTNSEAILAQSIGGEGGAGGLGVGAVSIGGKAGSAGNGGNAIVGNTANLSTSKNDSSAILAQSMGGGGGTGGGSVAVAPFVAVSVGSKGGGGGDAGSVIVNNLRKANSPPDFNLTTQGDRSKGINAQSTGGGGGQGGFSIAAAGGPVFSASVSVGGSGSLGGDGGEVRVFNQSAINTEGASSQGIFAQSEGGGGGASHVGVAASGSTAVSASVTVGGSGGGGGNGDGVTVTNQGEINTAGNLSSGVDAQSVGGGGGDAWVSIAGAAAGFAAIDVAIGGTGGASGTGGTVMVTNDGEITTNGTKSHGIKAESAGGGGGSGGVAIGASFVGTGGAVSVAIGGTGGTGNTGGTVTVINRSRIFTGQDPPIGSDGKPNGKGSYGILATSVGGGGGTGGVSGNLTATLGPAGSASVAIGGKGGSGNVGGAVRVTSTGELIKTTQDDGIGIYAASTGGGGGNAGFSLALALSPVQPSVNASVAVGGEGGSGNKGGNVTVTNDSRIETAGANSYGINAESQGGGGGHGGQSISGILSNVGILESSTSVGGAGGSSNTGGTVTVTNEIGRIKTFGKGAHGIRAKSIGGGGGKGGNAISAILGLTGIKTNVNIGVAVGGEGGSGNLGGKVVVTNGLDDTGENPGPVEGGMITTEGANAHAIYAQSIGGGGGDGGESIDAIVDVVKVPTGEALNVAVSVGGKGGNGNNGGIVEVTNNRGIETSGAGSYGILAQNVGGGGGIAGEASTVVFTAGCPIGKLCRKLEAKSLTIQVAVGGDGGGASDGGPVTVTNRGSITTRGDVSDGILAQSIGGGGGLGGNAILGKEPIDSAPLLAGTGLLVGATALLIGDLRFGVGGKAGASGNGGKVVVNSSGNITTHGSNSKGILAQSIGGGGGVGGLANIGITGALGIGGSGGAGGNGGDVEVVTGGGTIETFGSASTGIYAQSVGEGGGQSGNVDRGLPDKLNIGIGFGLQCNPDDRSDPCTGGGGSGGTVTVKSTEATVTNIITHGEGAHGIFAQSVGGGGGELGTLGSPDIPQLSFAGTRGGFGHAGKVTVTYIGNIETSGSGAHGIFAQSAGGRAAWQGIVGDKLFPDQGNCEAELGAGKCKFVTGPNNSGLAGAVDVTVTGDITVKGEKSVAILANSEAVFDVGSFPSGKNISITINSDSTVQADGNDGATSIFIKGGDANTVTNHGTITTLNGVAGFAIEGIWGSETIDNSGAVTGNVDLTGLTIFPFPVSEINAFNNKEGATFNMGSTVRLGLATEENNKLTNDGWLAPGATGSIATVLTSDLAGNIVQSSTGSYVVDLDFVAPDAVTGKADRINVSGTAELQGEVDLVIVNPNQASPGYHEVTILSAAQNVTVPSLVPDAPASAVTMYDILYPTLQDVVLSYDIDFAPVGLNSNQASFGEFINSLQLAGGSPTLAPLVGAIFGLGTLEELKLAYDMLSPEAYASSLVSTLVSANDFSSSLMSCRERGGDYRFVAQGECGWMRVSARSIDYDGTVDYFGFKEDSYQIAGGVQKAVAQDWHLGFGLSYENTQSTVENLASINGDRVQGGMVIKGRSGATTWAGSVIGGHGWFDTARTVNIGNVGGVATGTQELSFISGHMQIAYVFEHGDTYFRPVFEAAITSVHQYGFTETGGGLGNLAIDARDELYVALTPALEVGAELALGDGANLLRPRVKVGVTQYLGDSNPTVFATLVGTPDGVSSFGASAGFDETLGNVELGFDLLTQGGVTIRMDGVAQFGENTEIYQGNLKVAVPF